jgi:hypothetical protein
MPPPHPGCAGVTRRKEAARGQLEKVNANDPRRGAALLDAAGEEWARRSLRPRIVAVSGELCQRYPMLVGLFNNATGHDQHGQQ